MICESWHNAYMPTSTEIHKNLAVPTLIMYSIKPLRIIIPGDMLLNHVFPSLRSRLRVSDSTHSSALLYQLIMKEKLRASYYSKFILSPH